MKAISKLPDKITKDGTSVERGHAAWKIAKIGQGLAESKERDALIPIDQVWRDLKLEG